MKNRRIGISLIISLFISYVASFVSIHEVSFFLQESSPSFASSFGAKLLFWVVFFCFAYLPFFIFYVRSNQTDKVALRYGLKKVIQMYVSILISAGAAVLASWISIIILWGAKADQNEFGDTLAIVFWGVLLLVLALMMILLVFKREKRK